MLSKTKILAGLQCPKRLWLEVHRPELAEDSSDAIRKFEAGDRVTEVARSLHPKGILVAGKSLRDSLQKTSELLATKKSPPLFEAAFSHRDVVVRTDILSRARGKFHLTEVKSATKVKDEYLPDCAIQAWVLRGAGVDVSKVRVAYIDKTFVYPGDQEYDGLFAEKDVSEDIQGDIRHAPKWVKEFKRVLEGTEPDIDVGSHCHTPHECPFLAYCSPRPTKYPVDCLPYGGKVVQGLLADGIRDIRKIPKGRLKSATHEWIREVTRRGKAELRPKAVAHLKKLSWPRYFLDFETVAFAVPFWKGTSPYEALPFQWSCHIENREGRVEHKCFLDTTGDAPMRRFGESLINVLGHSGPIFVYSDFEKKCIAGLATRFRDLAPRLRAITDRLVDLLPVTREAYYHPDMLGSWSIKRVLPTIAPHLDYASLGEVQDGGGMNEIYLELTNDTTTKKRKATLESDLLAYCQMDTRGLVELMRFYMKH